MTPSAGDPGRKKRSSENAPAVSSKRPVRVEGERLSCAHVVAATHEDDLAELYKFWVGKRMSTSVDSVSARECVLECMADQNIRSARVDAMGQRMLTIFDALLGSPRFEMSFSELALQRQLTYLSKYDLEAALTLLERHALVVPSQSKEMMQFQARSCAIPFDLAEQVMRSRRAHRRGVFDVFALRGHFERMNNDPARKVKMPAKRQRELYKMYSNESAAVARIERLPDGLRQLVEKVVLEFGGLFTKDLFERMEHDLPHWNGRRWGKMLEECLVGTVERLDLSRYGLQHSDETLIVFNEVALAWLKRVAVPGDPDAPREEASLGVDLVSNISRFLGYILEHNVRFTVRGEIYKATEQRIVQDLIPNPGRELAREEVLGVIFQFARDKGLIERTGERTFVLTSAGREWEPLDLQQKMEALLEAMVVETGLGGEVFHQVRLRRIYLRLLKRIEVGVWYDLMYVPFLARNTYLSNLDELGVEGHFEAGSYTQEQPQEDLQRLAWNLVGWVRKRLYLLGMVDLGYDGHARPVAMRLTRLGARVLGMETESEGLTGVGNLIVTPDFEVVMFPTGDDGALIHDLDRFCKRDKKGDLPRFKILERGVQRALSEGMLLGRILSTLVDHSRTPVPQNVLFSIGDWASRAGLLQLASDHHVRTDNRDVMQAFLADPGVRPFISKVVDQNLVRLKSNATPKRMASVLRELGFLVELSD
ncbi:MAG: hypothetical protein ACI9F9_001932 [Candidatus Paceibacteria bacterium]